MDPTRSGHVLARHASIDEKTGQLNPDEDGEPRRLVISSDFYKVYESAGKKADGLLSLWCWAHVRRHPRDNTITGVADSDRHVGCRHVLSQDFRILTLYLCGYESAPGNSGR